MKPEDPDGTGVPWTAGMISVLRSEAERLRALSRSLEDQAVELRQIDPRGWTGRGHDAYSARRTELAARCRMVAEEHARAARALDDFVAVLEQLTRNARDTADPAQLGRLAAQRAEAASVAAAVLTEVGEDLGDLRAMLEEFAPRRPLPSFTPITFVPPPDVTADPALLAPDLLLADPVEFDRRLQELSDAMLLFWSDPDSRPLVKPVANKGNP
ncbi:putative T7SS-secreted protein [Amycolatopsis umgeniensis]|uniref:Phytoene dehydrogenase-like protein n=1 Tax=Amycolatopsis umgeniensis TaxID=336628 RepID=A0A841B1M0_9PSEU|nr:hypothetical protein [Amycolatopsis umgeniensis]MBB5852218.1 phytoene dehydrogenase-like protein [Amycolatopsis umgeniensis]